MRDTAKVKEYNVKAVKRVLRSGEKYTKQQVALNTGLSVATCNTILNELEATKEALAKKPENVEVGRHAKVYWLNPDYSYVLCIYFDKFDEVKKLHCRVVNLYGDPVESEDLTLPVIDYKVLDAKIESMLEKFPQINRLCIGVPGVVEKEYILHCDMDELVNQPVGIWLKEKYKMPVIIENDMHLMVYGYYKKECGKNDTVSIAIFLKHVLPGSGTVVNGKVIYGHSKFAGQIGFLPYEVGNDVQIQMMKEDSYYDFLIKAAVSLIVFMNPRVLVLTGNLLNQHIPEKLKLSCKEYIQEEHIPEIIFIEDMDSYYLEGLFAKALEIE